MCVEILLRVCRISIPVYSDSLRESFEEKRTLIVFRRMVGIGMVILNVRPITIIEHEYCPHFIAIFLLSGMVLYVGMWASFTKAPNTVKVLEIFWFCYNVSISGYRIKTMTSKPRNCTEDTFIYVLVCTVIRGEHPSKMVGLVVCTTAKCQYRYDRGEFLLLEDWT